MIVSVLLNVTIIVLVLFKLFTYMFSRPPNFPPGPPRIPIFGSYLFLLLVNSKHIHKGVLWLSRFYKTDILGFYLGNTPTIVAQDFDNVKSLLNNQDFDGRPDIFVTRIRDPHMQLRGIFFTQDQFWKEQRRYSLRHLRDYGFGRRFSELEIEVRDEICAFLDILRSGPKYKHEFEIMKKDGQILAPNIFFSTMSNAFLKVLSGVKFTREEQQILFETGSGGMIFQKNADDFGKLLSLVPWIRHIFPNWSSYNAICKGNGMVYNFMKALVDKHVDTFDENHERNFIDMYIGEMRQLEKSGHTNSSFHYDQLVMICTDFFFPSLTAVPVTFAFLIQRFLLEPQALVKMQKEIDEVVGIGRLPQLDDRISLPYTEACIREIMRLETLVPSSIPHMALRDTKIGGFDIPKGTFALPGLFAFHNDKGLWGDPESFRPERFIGLDGKLDLKLDKSLPFGAGKRLCAGETFARNTLFLFISAFFQNFDISLPEGQPFPSRNQNSTGLITYTPEYWIKVTAR